MIKLDNIDFFFNEEHYVFNKFNLELDLLKKYWIRGDNGSGKTTLIHILLGILKVKGGKCMLSYEKKYTLFLPSTPFYEPYLRLEDFLYFYLHKVLKIPKNNINLEDIIKILNLEKHRRTLCKDLSKGTKQKIIISPLFTTYNWKYLFMDEPFEHLDMKTCVLLREKIKNSDAFLVLINHKQEIIEEIEQQLELVNL